MDSKYAYVVYLKGIQSGDVTADGKIVQLNQPAFKGQVDLVSVDEFKRLKRDFPDCIKGDVIKKDNLIHMVNYCYASLKEDAASLVDDSDDVRRRLNYFQDEFERDGVLVPDHMTESSINDLANKYFLFQDSVRNAQVAKAKKSHK